MDWVPCLRRAAVAIVAAIWGGIVSAHSQSAPMKEVLSLDLDAISPGWRVSAYQADGDRDEAWVSNTPARVCFHEPQPTRDQHCRSLLVEPNMVPGDVFQTVKDLSVVPLTSAAPVRWAVRVRSQSSYGGSGWLDRVDLWTFDSSPDQFHLLHTFTVSGQGEVRIITDGPLNGHVITADALWMAGETHFGRHHFAITVYRLDMSLGIYWELLRYVTKGRYPSFDDVDDIEVVSHEIPEVQRLLAQVFPTAK